MFHLAKFSLARETLWCLLDFVIGVRSNSAVLEHTAKHYTLRTAWVETPLTFHEQPLYQLFKNTQTEKYITQR